MRLRVDFNGMRDGDSYYSSVFVVLQQGEFDAEIPFPFNGQVKVSLLNQSNARNKQHVTTVIQCLDVPRNNSGASNARPNSRGRTRFIKKSELFSQTYCKQRVIYFDVGMVYNCDTCASPVTACTAAVSAATTSTPSTPNRLPTPNRQTTPNRLSTSVTSPWDFHFGIDWLKLSHFGIEWSTICKSWRFLKIISPIHVQHAESQCLWFMVLPGNLIWFLCADKKLKCYWC